MWIYFVDKNQNKASVEILLFVVGVAGGGDIFTSVEINEPVVFLYSFAEIKRVKQIKKSSSILLQF